jgi:hypothetical protein
MNNREMKKKEHVRNGVDLSNSKLPIALLALITPDGRTDPEDALPPFPRTHVNPKIVGAKIVNRTLLASTCDRARTMWMLGTGAETVTTAKTNLGLEALPIRGTDEEKYWQATNDVPDLKLFMSRMARRESQLEETPE